MFVLSDLTGEIFGSASSIALSIRSSRIFWRLARARSCLAVIFWMAELSLAGLWRSAVAVLSSASYIALPIR